MAHSLKSLVKILGARAISRVTGKVPDQGSWNTVWGGSRAYARNRWVTRDAEFERRKFDYDDALAFLAASGRGSARDIREGSIPKPALKLMAGYLKKIDVDRPLRGLHVGDFVGVSLAGLTDAARTINPGSVMVSIDPNIPHRGIDAPRDLAIGLMNRYGLEANWLPITGYSLARRAAFDILNDRRASTFYASYHGYSATRVLKNLTLVGKRFDFVLVDGNHNGDYLEREIAVIAELVRPGGLVFLDDVDAQNWKGVVRVFKSLDARLFRTIEHKERVGVVRRTLKGRKGGGGGRAGGPGRRARRAQEEPGAPD